MGYDPDGTWNWKRFFTGLAIVAVAAVVVAATVVSLPATSVVGKAIIGGTIGAASDMFTQTVIEGKDLSEVDYISVGISAATGVVSSFGLTAGTLSSGAGSYLSSRLSGESVKDSLIAGLKSSVVSFTSGKITQAIGKIKVGKIAKQNYQAKKVFLNKASNSKLHSYSPQINRAQGFKSFVKNTLSFNERMSFYEDSAGRGVDITVNSISSILSGCF